MSEQEAILAALAELGSSARAEEVREWGRRHGVVIDRKTQLEVSDKVLAEEMRKLNAALEEEKRRRERGGEQ